MKKWLPWIVTGGFAVWLLSTLRPPPEATDFHVNEFGRLPVLLNGRIQPFDSVARNTLLSIHGTQTVRPPKEDSSKKVLSATEWLLEVMTKPEDADRRKIFRVENIDLRNLLGAREGRLGQMALTDFDEEKLMKLETDAQKIAEKAAQQRTGYERDLLHLVESLMLYHRVKSSLRLSDSAPFLASIGKQLGEKAVSRMGAEGSDPFLRELELFRKSFAPGFEALRQDQAGGEYNKEDLGLFSTLFHRYQSLANRAYPLIVPPVHPDHSRDAWSNIGTSLMESLRSGEIHPAINHFAVMASAYRDGRAADFNRAVAEHKQWLASQGLGLEVKKGWEEALFNRLEPFYKSQVIYVVALLLGCAFWLNFSEPMRRSGYLLLWLAFIIHTGGLLFRMFHEGRPPVTNLYSSAVFVGWGAVVLGIFLERIFRDGIGIVTASSVGFITLIIAHHLSLGGDTMQMLQAVLDTNIWLATHVVIINIGYSATFLAGALAIIFIVRGLFTRSLTPHVSKGLTRMVYGTICFATLFTFVGTILGGIWADQSWGRFWGWDPKENGALLIVLVNALILHARWGGMIRERGLMALSVFGNIVTAWSWFGTNMLGVGLHSYGFMEKGFKWLLAFVISQVIVMALAMVPLSYWASFRNTKNLPEDSGPTGQPVAASA